MDYFSAHLPDSFSAESSSKWNGGLAERVSCERVGANAPPGRIRSTAPLIGASGPTSNEIGETWARRHGCRARSKLRANPFVLLVVNREVGFIPIDGSPRDASKLRVIKQEFPPQCWEQYIGESGNGPFPRKPWGTRHLYYSPCPFASSWVLKIFMYLLSTPFP